MPRGHSEGMKVNIEKQHEHFIIFQGIQFRASGFIAGLVL